MGRGDKSTRKGKIFAKSFGKRRRHKGYRKNKRATVPAERAVSPKRMPMRSNA